MSEYTEEYCLNHDIDYFAFYNGQRIHVASNGSIIPRWIDESVNYSIQKNLYKTILGINQEKRRKRRRYQGGASEDISVTPTRIEFDAIKRILYNEGYELHEITEKVIMDYASSFVEFAELGFRSYDTINDRLILIAEPMPDAKAEGVAKDKSLNLPISQRDDDFKLGFDDNYIELPDDVSQE